MLKQTNIATSAVIVVWYLFGAAAGWKGWAPAVGMMGSGGSGYSSGTRPGGHGSFYGGGWGGGK